MSNINNIVPHGNGRLYNHPFHHDNVLSGQIGKLIPVMCEEVLPGEYWTQNINFLMRMTPLTYPAMVKMNVCFYSFYVPTRIITPRNSQHSTWEKFVLSVTKSSEEIPDLPSLYTSTPLSGASYNNAKEMLKKYFAAGTLSDYLDLIGSAPTETEIENDNLFNIPRDFRVRLDGLLAYLSVYNYWFRRDQIEPEITTPLAFENLDLSNIPNSDYVHNEEWDSTSDADFIHFVDELFKLRTKNYERDYFTSSLPSPQFGEDVQVGDGLVSMIHNSQGVPLSPLANFVLRTTATSTPQTVNVAEMTGNLQTSNSHKWSVTPIRNSSNEYETQINLRANTFTINEFRVAMQMQAVREAVNRGGTMYIEVMQNIYDVLVPDARLQQPVYLGGIKCPVQIGTVVQTSETTATTPLGTLGGKAQSASGGQLFRSKKEFKEHGYVITIAVVAPRTGYVGGVPRKWLKKDPIDYYNKYFAHLGEQEVKKGELYFNPFNGFQGQTQTFGFQERYNEYRHAISRAHGAMRHKPKDAWHVYRQFDALPSLSEEFIKMEKEDFDRIFEFESIDGTINEHFDLICAFDIVKKSPVPKYGTPYSFI